MRLDQLFRNGQAEAKAAGAARSRILGLTESVEDVRQEPTVDSDTVIRNTDDEFVLHLLCGDVDPSAGTRKFQRVAEDVQENLLETSDVCMQARGRNRSTGDIEPLRCRGREDRFDHSLEKRGNVDIFE